MVDPRPLQISARRRRGNQSVKIGYSLLNVLSNAGSPLPLSKIAAATGLSPSKVHPYLTSYVEIGLVAQNPTTQHYGLGPAAIQLGGAAARQLDVFEPAQGVMESLKEETGLTVSLSVWGRTGPLVVHKVDGISSIGRARLGDLLSVLGTATGHLYYAYLPEGYWRSLVDYELADQANVEHTKDINVGRIREERLSSHIYVDGFSVIATPILNRNDEIVGTIAALDLHSGDYNTRYEPTTCALKHAAERVSVHLIRAHA